MDVVVFLPVLLLTCGALGGVVRQLLLYPAPIGKSRYAFSSTHRDSRQALHDARRQRQALINEHRQKVSEVERPYRESARSKRKRVRELEKERTELLQRGHGELVAELGELRLRQHVLVVLKEESQESGDVGEYKELPLADLGIDTKFASTDSFIEITRSNGTKHSVAFPLDRHSAAEVKRFADRIENEALKDRDFRSSRHGRVAELNAQIKQLKGEADAEEETGRREADKVRNVQSADPRQAQVDATWKEQCDAWEALTGRRPQWWWRW